jgi:hypothetical protein
MLSMVVVAGIQNVARAGDCCPPPCCPAPCVIVKKVCCTEWVPEHYECTRTVYKTEYKDEVYTATKTECVPEVRTRTCTVYRSVNECREEVRTVTKFVPTVEERCVTKYVKTTQQVTTMCKKTVKVCHTVCKEVPRRPTKCERQQDKCLCVKPCYTKIVECTVREKVCVECPVTKCVTVCVPVVQKVCVTVCKPVCEQITVKVNYCKLIPETKVETYTVMVPKCVPVQCVRRVAVCVPVIEKYTACRMVPHTVEKEVIQTVPCGKCK